MKKHLGVTANNNRSCAVVMMSIPGDDNHSLIVDLDAITERVRDPILSVLNSNDGQRAVSLADALHRSMTPDGTQTMLSYLHNNNLLRKEPVRNIHMTPVNGHAVPLVDILAQMKAIGEQVQPSKEEVVTDTVDPAIAAQALLAEAKMLVDEAEQKTERANQLDPSLRPAAMDNYNPMKVMEDGFSAHAASETTKVTPEEVLNELRK